jgi:hypothetical protein
MAASTTEDEHVGLLGLLNSSTACFWLKQVMANKGGGGIGGGLKSEYWDRIFVFNATKAERFPVAAKRPGELSRALHASASNFVANLPFALCNRAIPSREALDAIRAEADPILAHMVALQEELDWQCYGIYGLVEDAPEHLNPPSLRLGERAFEIYMARRMVAGQLETAWFERHRSAPVTEFPANWSSDYRAVVERRIALIESDPTIGIIERPEYKRRWSTPTWEEMERDALRTWLLDRLEDSRVGSAKDPRLVSTNQLTDLMRLDGDFMSVAALYVGRTDLDIESLIADLVAKECVPFLSNLRYSETGLRKRNQWEETWDLQRREDAIDAEVMANRNDFLDRAHKASKSSWRDVNPGRSGEAPEAYAVRMADGVDAEAVDKETQRLTTDEQRRRKQKEIGQIPVPPKYRTADFQSQVYWRLRGGLDVPKERFVSFPGCHRDADGSLVVIWAGYDHLARARAIAAYYLERKDSEGWSAERLVPLLAGLLELQPWLRQWHNDYDPALGVRMGDYFAEFVREEARGLGMTEAAVAVWTPPAAARRGRRRRAAL